VSNSWVTYIARKRSRKRAEIGGPGTAEAFPAKKEREASDFVLDERTGLLLPEGARAKKRQPGFGAEWDE
jgi:hypothetical protein